MAWYKLEVCNEHKVWEVDYAWVPAKSGKPVDPDDVRCALDSFKKRVGPRAWGFGRQRSTRVRRPPIEWVRQERQRIHLNIANWAACLQEQVILVTGEIIALQTEESRLRVLARYEEIRHDQ